MRVVHCKNGWKYEDLSLVGPGSIPTPVGKSIYWHDVDNALEFNIKKKEEFLARELVYWKRNKHEMSSQRDKAEKRPISEDNRMQTFFNKLKCDKFHWYKNNHGKPGDKYMLPRPRR